MAIPKRIATVTMPEPYGREGKRVVYALNPDAKRFVHQFDKGLLWHGRTVSLALVS